MNEAEWLAATDPTPMLEFLRDAAKASDRKFRLFQVACCRRAWHLLPDDSCREAVLIAERYADGQAKDRERRSIRNRVARHGKEDPLLTINAQGAVFAANEKTTWRRLPFLGVAAVFGHAANPTRECGTAAYRTAFQAEAKAEADLVRCPFYGSRPGRSGCKARGTRSTASACGG
jgi:hypothetical protein